MAKVFISYSSRNQELALCFIEFLQLGMGICGTELRSGDFSYHG